MSQFDRAETLVRVGRQAPVQIADGLTQAERPDRHDPRAARDGCGVGGGHQHPPGRAWPQTFQVRRIGQVIEYHQPRTAGLAQPAEELGGDRLATARLVPAAHGGRRRGVAGQHRGPARGLDPDQQVYTARMPQRLGESHGQLGLTRRPQPILCIGSRPIGNERDRGPSRQRSCQGGGRLRPDTETLGQPRHRPRPDGPAWSAEGSACRARGRHCAAHGALLMARRMSSAGEISWPPDRIIVAPSLPSISTDRQSPGQPSAPQAVAHSSWLKTSTGVVLVSVSLRKKAGAVTRMKVKPITPARAASAAMMKVPPICQCRTGTVHMV